MPRDQLLGLAADADRLLAAGAAAAVANDGLARRARTLRDLGQKVPALLPVADAVDRVTGSAPTQVGPAFLDLIQTARQLRASLTACGVPGDLQPVPESGPWRMPLAMSDLRRLSEALTGSGGVQEEMLRKAAQLGELNDLRLVPALAAAVGYNHERIADLIAEEVLPTLGRGTAVEVAALLRMRGGAADMRRLRTVCRLEPELGAQLCRRALAEGAPALRAVALGLLPDLIPASEAERVGLEYIKDGSNDVRAAAFAALRKGSSTAALEALLAAQADRSDEVRAAAAASLNTLAHPATTGRLLALVREDRAALDALPPPPKPKPEPKPAKGTGKAKGKTRAAPPPPPMEDPARKRLLRQLSWLARAVGGRSDDRDRLKAALLPLTRQADEELRAATLEGMGGSASDPEVKQALRAALDGKAALRAAALKGLAKLPPAERLDVVERARELALSPHLPWDVRLTAFAALRDLEDRVGKELVEGLVKLACEESNFRIQRLRAQVFEGLSPAAAPLFPDLIEALFTAKFSSEMGPILVRLDPDGSRVVPRLIEVLSNPRKNHYSALEALYAYGLRAQAAAPAVRRLIEKNSPYESYARGVLRCIEP
jgi:hypothetical protein